jgi:hypothetical protein
MLRHVLLLLLLLLVGYIVVENEQENEGDNETNSDYGRLNPHTESHVFDNTFHLQ